MVMTDETFRRKAMGRVRMSVETALDFLHFAMEIAPGPYPDPECPIEKWQAAHQHLLAAQKLLEQ